MTEKENHSILHKIDGEVIKFIKDQLNGAKHPVETLNALAHALIYQGAQCAQRMHSSEQDCKPFVRACCEAALKDLQPDVIVPAKIVPNPPKQEN